MLWFTITSPQEVSEGYALQFQGTHAYRHTCLTHGSILILQTIYMSHGRVQIQGALFIQKPVIVTNLRKNKCGNHCTIIGSCTKRMGIKKHSSLLLFLISGLRQIMAMSFLTANIQLIRLMCHSYSVNSVSSQLSINLRSISFHWQRRLKQARAGSFFFCFLPDSKKA